MPRLDALPGPYLTKLNPQQEQQFQAWVRQNNVPFDPSPNADYDMRGFFLGLQNGDPHAKTAVNQYDNRLHFTDYYKTPYHETFSNESRYATGAAPRWVGSKLIDSNGRVLKDESQ
jgi:hypothetical protein